MKIGTRLDFRIIPDAPCDVPLPLKVGESIRNILRDAASVLLPQDLPHEMLKLG